MLGGKHGVSAITVIAIALSTTAAAVDGKTATAQLDRTVAANTGLALGFVENKGQTNARVRYYAQGDRYAFFATRDRLVLSFAKRQNARGLTLALRFLGRDPASAPQGADRQPGTVNYLRGAGPARWQTSLRHYGAVVYRGLWPRIDLRLHQAGGALKYEFRVRPGARPSDIRLAYAGARRLAMDAAGNLLIESPVGTLRDSHPVSHQDVAGVRVPVASRYLLSGNRFGFAVGRYRHDRDLIIDPGIEYTTFIGGSSDEIGNGIAVDGNGNAYVTGTTQSPDFPTTVGAFSRTGAAGNNPDVFVSKLNPTGTALVYSTFIGGSGFDFGRRIAIDAGGNAYITGQTTSANFPTTANAFSRRLHIPPNCPRCVNADNYDGFVAKLNASGSGLAYSTYLGGTDIDSPRGVAVDGAGNAYVTGETVSVDFPTTAGAFSRTEHGAYDMFVTKVNATGSALAYSTYLGGAQVDNGERVAVDSGGNAYVLGFTSSLDFPTTPGAFDTTANGDFDVSVTKLNPAGSALVYSTYLGGQGSDSGGGLAIDAAGNAYVSGGAGSLDFPTTPGAFDTTSDGNDAFVTKLNPVGSAAVYSTLVGGTGGDGASGVVVDSAGNAWLTGVTSSGDFPMSADAADGSFNGVADAFISELNSAGSAVVYSTYLGGAQSDSGTDIARDSVGNVYITGRTFSMDFPATTGAFDTVWNGDPLIFWGDAFVTKLALGRTTSTPPAPPPVPSAPVLVSPPNGDTPPQPITFDWNNVAGAASYTIQIDDSSAFTAPLEREATVTDSMYATTDLSTATHFWRVRGVNSAGVAGPWSAVRSFTPQAAPPPAVLSTMDINPATVVGGNNSSGTVVLSTPAPANGAVVTLSSSNPAVASVPATVTVPPVGFTGSFTITTSPVSANVTVVITASYNGTTRTGTLTVTPPGAPPPPATIQSVSVSPAAVTGGSTAQGAVTLSGAAPQAGATVSLSSSNAGAATVPASVTIPSGASTATFAVSTSAVATSTPVTISATYNGATATTSLTVDPAPPPPQTATLTVTATGRAGERVTSSPAGISVATGSSGSASFATGTSVTLSVSNGRDAIWSGACSSNGSKTTTCTFTLSAAASVTANVQ
ncbi:MAG: hypothetical protein HOQ28_19680 [Thermoleophilia bacterium]|nr:hypothetical protein [Thermoleophilia bacterium]